MFDELRWDEKKWINEQKDQWKNEVERLDKTRQEKKEMSFIAHYLVYEV